MKRVQDERIMVHSGKFFTFLLVVVVLSLHPVVIGQSQGFDTFVENEEGIQINYPSDWYVKEYRNPGTYQVFLSLEPILGPQDQYQTGMGFMVIREARDRMSLLSDDPAEVSADWRHRYEKSLLEENPTQVDWDQKNNPILIESMVAYQSQLRTQFLNKPGAGIIMVYVYIADDFYVFIFESTRDQFKAIKPIFDEMIQSIKIRPRETLRTKSAEAFPIDLQKKLEATSITPNY